MKKIMIIFVIFILFFLENVFSQMSNTGKRIDNIRKYMRQKSNQGNKFRKRKSKKKRKPKVKLKFYKAKVMLSGGTIFKGKIKTLLKNLTIKHRKNGIEFKKVLKSENIKSIEIAKYSPRLLRNGNKYKAYYFVPFKYKIIYNDGNIYYYNRTLPNLLKFRIFSSLGQAVLKTYFIDYWLKIKKIWYFSKSSDRKYPINNARHKTVIKIDFGK